MTVEQAVAKANEHFTLALTDLIESPLNPRTRYANLEELADSIRSVGVLVPLIVRVRKGMVGIGIPRFEVIAGARRFRASKLAELLEVPVVVHDMTDTQALAAMLIENAQRDSLHPYEEAEGVHRLKELGVPIEEIPEKLGKKRSRAEIYNTLELLRLVPKAKDYFFETDERGQLKLSKSHALVLAGIADERQQLAALHDYTDGEAKGFTVRAFRDWVRQRYMLDLSKAPFDIKDADLVPAAGACFGCPFRTGTKPDLFEGVGKDFCTKPSCYGDKAAAEWATKVAERTALGLRTLTPEETKATFEPTGVLKIGTTYRRAEEQCSDDPKARTFKQLLGKGGRGKIILARTPRGDEIELVDGKTLREDLTAAGHDFWASEAKSTSRAAAKSGASKKARSDDDVPDAEVARRARERADRETLVRRTVVMRLVAAVEKTEPGKDFWRALIQECLDAGSSDFVLERRFGGDEDPKAMAKWLEKAGAPQLRGLAFELVLEGPLYEATSTSTLKELCRLYRVDESEVRAEVKQALKAKDAAAADVITRLQFRTEAQELGFKVRIEGDETLTVKCSECSDETKVPLSPKGDVSSGELVALKTHQAVHAAKAKKKGGR